jgi:uncharacterized membrane protein YtjA (UPF0391 family)
MTTEAIIFLVVGIVDILFAWMGILTKFPKGRRWADRIGDTNAKIMYTVIGLILIVIALVFL